nr:MAG TPA: hypothetical protein [Caudoviricetes sp.]
MQQAFIQKKIVVVKSRELTGNPLELNLLN